MVFLMSVRVVIGVGSGGCCMLGVLVRVLSVVMIVSLCVFCGGLCVGESRDFYCGVKILFVFCDFFFFFRWDVSLFRKNR